MRRRYGSMYVRTNSTFLQTFGGPHPPPFFWGGGAGGADRGPSVSFPTGLHVILSPFGEFGSAWVWGSGIVACHNIVTRS